VRDLANGVSNKVNSVCSGLDSTDWMNGVTNKVNSVYSGSIASVLRMKEKQADSAVLADLWK
jgi:hypothetical protein